MITRRALLAALAQRTHWPFAYSFKGYPQWPLEKAFSLTAQLGYTGVELFEPAKVDATEARRLAAKHKLPIVAIMEDLRLTGDAAAHLRQLESSCKLSAQIGRPLIETVVGGKPEEWTQLRPQFLERLKPWAVLAEKYKVVVAIKAHIGSALHLPEDAAGLCREINSPYLKINYDYSHFQLQGLDLETTLKAALPYIAMVHIKDWTGTRDKFRFALPGEGSIDYTAYAALLRRLNYRGPIVVEVSAHVLQRPGYNPENAARFVADTVLPKFR
ncbi:MAG TPA: sugar phosphate isomerase/epimerase family protein [Bryobacteraceae bacterium]|nr:sugar phosphate isomerase/epimerase family protein [Bryobacteraceae bacterium]